MINRFGYGLIVLWLVFLCVQNTNAINIGRDIIFSPNETVQVAGKVMYFDPNEFTEIQIDSNRNEDDVADNIDNQYDENPWLEPLKQALYLVLNNKINGNANKSEVASKRDIQLAGYISLNAKRIQQFGDIIALAHGRLDKDQLGSFQIVELNENCIKACSEAALSGNNVSAFWSVLKIRHRDESRGYRFEWKITIRPLRNSRFDNKRDTDDGSSKTRSFLIRDQDYPNYFIGTQKIKSDRRMEKRIFNTLYDQTDVPFYLNYQNQFPLSHSHYDQDAANLNIGEYYMEGPSASAHLQIPYASKPIRFQELPPPPPPPPIQLNGPNIDNLHHHYFLNQNEVPIAKTSQYEKINMFTPNGLNRNGYLHHGQHQLRNIPQIAQRHPIENRDHGHNHYRDVVSTQQAPFHFPDQLNAPLTLNIPTRSPFRGAYDDNRESILEGEFGQQNFNTPFELNTNFLAIPARNNKHVFTSTVQITSTPYSYEKSTSPATSTPQTPSALTSVGTILPNHHPQQYSHPIHSVSNPHQANQLYWLGSPNLQYANGPHVNFEGSYPYQENRFSELDPIYHSPGVLVTPVNVLNGINNDDAGGTASQFPSLRNQEIETSSINSPSENHQTTKKNIEPNYTTPFNTITSTQKKTPQHDDDNDDKRIYPDSINAQLPPPESDADLTVPYVDSPILSEKPISKKEEQNIAQSESDFVTTEKHEEPPNKMEKYMEDRTPVSVRYRGRTTSEKTSSDKQTSDKATQKWLPKRSRYRGSGKFSNDRPETHQSRRRSPSKVVRTSTTTTTTTTNATTTPDVAQYFDDKEKSQQELVTSTAAYVDNEPRTSQSIQKSVSVHVGDGVTVLPITSTETSLIFNKTAIDKSFLPALRARPNITRMAIIKKVENIGNETVSNETPATLSIV